MKLTPEQVSTDEVKQWQGLHLLHYDMSSCSQKVRILLGELDISFNSHHIDLRKNEQKSDWYLGINPNGVVPTLIHNGDVHIESNDIIQYLDNQFATPKNSLLPNNESKQNEMQTLMDLEDELHKDLRTVTFTYLAPAIHDGIEEDHQSLDYIGRFNEAFTTLDGLLAHQPFVHGEKISLTDISWFITLHRLHLAGYPLEHHPALQAYYHRLSNRPAFKKQVSSGPLLLRFAGVIYRNLRRLKRSLRKDFAAWHSNQPANALPTNR